MKAEELRINNWVKDENGPYQIKGEHLDEDNFPTIQTWEIPLTEEWLIKFGFTKRTSPIIDSYTIDISPYKILLHLT